MKENCHFLNSINKKLTKSKRAKIFNKADAKSLNAVGEIVQNLLRGVIPLPEYNLKKLRRYKNPIRKLGRKKISKRLRKSILIQHGGFLPLVLSPLLSLVAGAAGKYIGSKL